MSTTGRTSQRCASRNASSSVASASTSAVLLPVYNRSTKSRAATWGMREARPSGLKRAKTVPTCCVAAGQSGSGIDLDWPSTSGELSMAASTGDDSSSMRACAVTASSPTQRSKGLPPGHHALGHAHALRLGRVPCGLVEVAEQGVEDRQGLFPHALNARPTPFTGPFVVVIHGVAPPLGVDVVRPLARRARSLMILVELLIHCAGE
eukprot:scaffold92143_cov69-Phaeocystis_antarctica.AAC.3